MRLKSNDALVCERCVALHSLVGMRLWGSKLRSAIEILERTI